MTLVDPVPLKNTSGEMIPTGAVAKVTEVTDSAVQVDKPDADDDPNFVVVGMSVIPADSTGQGTFHPRVIVAYDAADGTPAAGETWGVKAGEWKIKKDYQGFLILGGAGGGLVNALRVPAAAATATASAGLIQVRVASTANGTLASAFENGDTLDGVVLATGDRILLKDQTTGADRGIYTVNASGAPTRATDADGTDEMVGAVVFVSEGTANRNTIWACVTDATITPGSTSTVWVQLTPEICEVTVTDTGSGHTVKKKTVSAGAMVDVSGPVTFSPCYSATGSALAVGTKVLLVRVPDVQSAANYWIFPTANSLTVEEDDGSPSYTGIGTLQFEHHAFVVTQPAAGKALVSTNFTVEESDGSPSYAGIYDLQFDSIFHTVTQPAAGKALVTFALPHGQGSGYDTYTGTTTTWTNILVNGTDDPLVLPGHGTYQLVWSCRITFTMPDPGLNGSADINSFRFRWQNVPDAVNYTDYLAASSRLTTQDLNPGGAPNDTVWEFCVSRTQQITVTEGTDTNKNFQLQGWRATSSGTATVSELVVDYIKLSAS